MQRSGTRRQPEGFPMAYDFPGCDLIATTNVRALQVGSTVYIRRAHIAAPERGTVVEILAGEAFNGGITVQIARPGGFYNRLFDRNGIDAGGNYYLIDAEDFLALEHEVARRRARARIAEMLDDAQQALLASDASAETLRSMLSAAMLLADQI
jgi:hypothetical protein